MDLKKLLTTEMPTISKSTPYWEALKVCSLLFLLPEAVMIFALLFKQVTLTEFWQISLFLLLLWPIMPMILRIKKNRLLGVVICVVLIIIVAFLVSMKIADHFYIKKVFRSYLQGEDFQRQSDSLLKFASSNAISYTKFLIEESEFFRRSVFEANLLKESSRHDQTEEICKLRKRIREHLRELDERFIATGYSNKNTVVVFELLRGKYNHLSDSLEGILNAGK